MKEQNYSNHRKFVIGYHIITYFLLMILFISSCYNLYVSFKSRVDIRYAIMFFIISVVLILINYYLRSFALKAQDRAIRAEENLRHFAMTGKLLDPKLNVAQIVALRFAPDEEFISLSQKAVSENISSSDIKKLITNWKADHDRV